MVLLFFAIVGMVRGYAKELGSTLVILVAMFVLTQFGETALRILSPGVASTVGIKDTSANLNLLNMLLLQGVFVAIIFAAYQGETLAFEGRSLQGPEGAILSLALGVINGYLVAGTLWYYLDHYKYPVGSLFKPPLSPLAEAIIPYLPPNVLGAGALTALIALMILLRIRR
jgi:uncharacterized membrane protein required for colicin V production